jgi:metallo-beta-lactamase family protein
MNLQFLGAVHTVTGSSTLVEGGGTRLLVDCGLFQGLKHLRLRNWDDRGADAPRLDAVVLTHAHLDHSGYLPRLVTSGFRGPILCTPPTAALLRVLLLDAAKLQEEDSDRANRRGYSRHQPALPLYTTRDAEQTLGLVQLLDWDVSHQVGALEVLLRPAGHMLGASSVQVGQHGRTVLFSGDLGRPDDVLLHPPRPFAGADLLVVESTYGDRLHGDQDPADELCDVVNEVCGRGGVLMVPSFAVGRAQALMHLLASLTAAGRIPRIPTFLNSPMAISATDIFCDHPDAHRLSTQMCRDMEAGAQYVRTVDQSKALNRRKGPLIVIAGSGMISGGRILHHLAAFAGDPKNGLLLVGYQAAGTRGAQIAAGAEWVRLHGRDVPVKCELFTIDALSGHADWKETIDWLRDSEAPSQVLINHGEPTAADAMRLHLRYELGWEAEVALEGRSYKV